MLETDKGEETTLAEVVDAAIVEAAVFETSVIVVGAALLLFLNQDCSVTSSFIPFNPKYEINIRNI